MLSEELFTHFGLAKNSSIFWALLAFLQAEPAELSNISEVLIISRVFLALLFSNGYIYYKLSQHSAAERSLSNGCICLPAVP